MPDAPATEQFYCNYTNVQYYTTISIFSFKLRKLTHRHFILPKMRCVKNFKQWNPWSQIARLIRMTNLLSTEQSLENRDGFRMMRSFWQTFIHKVVASRSIQMVPNVIFVKNCWALTQCGRSFHLIGMMAVLSTKQLSSNCADVVVLRI